MPADSLKETINTIIGEGTTFNGDFDLNGPLRIDGILRGNIKSDSRIIVGTQGHVQTSLHARQVVVAGRIDGNIYASEGVHLMKTAVVNGDIFSANLVVDEGVEFEGRAKINRSFVKS